jgi:predicted CoA-binding protein
VSGAIDVLRAAGAVVVVDWPSADVPDSLARAGFAVFVKGGPGPSDWSVRELLEGEVVVRQTGDSPRGADLVYSHRPLAELPGIVAMARELGAGAVWWQSGLADASNSDPTGCWVSAQDSERARAIVEEAGMRYVDDVYIAEVARAMTASGHHHM